MKEALAKRAGDDEQPAEGSAAAADGADDVEALKKRLAEAEKLLALRDAEIKDKAERIDRLTKRLVNAEGLA
jgi:hypothetical protein